MANDFSDLIEKFGAPRLVIPNTERFDHSGSAVKLSDGTVKINNGKPFRRQKKIGETQFLAIRGRIETWLANEEKLLAHLKKKNLTPIETIYFYKDARAWDYSTSHWKDSKIAIATEADVEPLTREELLREIEERRVVWVGGWSSMGDGYVNVSVCAPDNLPAHGGGYHFLFAPPCRIYESMLAKMGEGFEWESEFFNCYSSRFSRPFLMDK